MQNIANLGKSFEYPLQPDQRGQVAKVRGDDNINQSIYSVLITPEGAAFYQEDRGSLLHTLVFEPNDDVLKSLLDYHIVKAVSKWEKRITVTDIYYEAVSDNVLNCRIMYIVKATGLESSYVYPFNREIDR